MGEVYRAPRPEAEPRRRDQGPARSLHPGQGAPRAIRARSAAARPAQPPQHRSDLSGWRRAARATPSSWSWSRARPSQIVCAQGALPLDESLSIARQIAEALEEAHEKGIVHRDLKPQNVKASHEGKIKVLDFGLAKAMDPAAGSASVVAGDLLRSPTLMQSPTLTAAHGTQLGVILGTAAYMAPEQAAGRSVDRRADIWAFGVVLFEMLTGRRLFEGETVSHVLAGVLKDEPDFSALPAATPERIRNLVRRCLRKRPRERLQSIGDARVVIEEVIADPMRDVRSGATPGTAPGEPVRAARLAWAVAATGIAAAAAFAALWLGARDGRRGRAQLRARARRPGGDLVHRLLRPLAGRPADPVRGISGGHGRARALAARPRPRRCEETRRG